MYTYSFDHNIIANACVYLRNKTRHNHIVYRHYYDDAVFGSAGGYDKAFSTDRASVECFDPSTNEWQFVAEMEKARSGVALVALDHYLYMFGGRSRYNDQYLSIAERSVHEHCREVST